jgi:hypothetical protein
VRESQLRRAALEIDAARTLAGWDQPARLYALVDTERLLAQEPSLAVSLGLSTESPGFTAVEQEPLDTRRTLEEVLGDIEWPPEVDGCAAAVERLVLPPSAERSLPDDGAAQRAYAAGHPERQEVRIVAAVLRDGSAHCALRVRGHDGPQDLVEGPDLVPALTRLLADTLDADLRD